MVVEVRLVGPPLVARDGVSARFDTRKAIALLAYLALSDRPRPREVICELLWSEYDPESARGALRRTLSTLRGGLGAEHLDTSGETVALLPKPGLSIDVMRVRGLTAEGATVSELAAASDMLSGEFLEGFSVRDSANFDLWQQVQSVRLRREHTSVLRRLVDGLIAADDLHSAIPVAERWLTLDPLHEPAHRQLIRLLAWTGHRAEALEQYRSCVRILHHELGVRPVSETAALRDQIDEGTLTPTPPAPLPATHARAPGDLPLVGRLAELAALHAAYADSRAGTRLAVIEGEPGIGKTRLSQELAADVVRRGGRVLIARGYEGAADIPYGPIVDLLRETVQASSATPGWLATISDQQLADAGGLMPEIPRSRHLPPLRPVEGSAAKIRLLEAVVAILAAACRGPAPGLVVVDDVHAADDATLDTLQYMVRRLSDSRLLVVLAWRSERIPPGHRMRQLLMQQVRSGLATVVRPERLSPGDVSVIAAAAGYDDDVARQVHLESEGLPLFATEYLTAMRLGERSDAGMPTEIRGLLESRLAPLRELSRQVLDAAAVLGRKFNVDTLRAVSGRAEEETVAAVEEALSAGLLHELREDPPTYEFTHSKLAEMVYDELSLGRRRLLHRRAAEEIARLPRGAREAAQAARHLQAAGAEAQSAEQHRIAALLAAEVQATEDAISHLEAAIALGHPDVASLHETIGDLATLKGDYARAFDAFQSASLYETVSSVAIEHKIGDVHQRRGDWERAARHYRAALQLTDDPALVARISADLALTLLATHQLEAADEMTDAALMKARGADDRAAQAQAHNIRGILARTLGDLDRASAELEISLALSVDLDDEPAQTAALNNLALVHRQAGNLSTALALTERALGLCTAYGDRHRQAALENNLADLHHAAGREEQALVHLKRAVAIFSSIGGEEATRLSEIWKLVSW